jgi:hypothetical protein
VLLKRLFLPPRIEVFGVPKRGKERAASFTHVSLLPLEVKKNEKNFN